MGFTQIEILASAGQQILPDGKDRYVQTPSNSPESVNKPIVPAQQSSVDKPSRVEELLVESILASDRTTHAVRAFVRFLFIQLSATSLAYFVWNLADNFIDEYECAQYGDHCSPNGFLSFLGVAIFIMGVIFSSRAGWSELEKSNI